MRNLLENVGGSDLVNPPDRDHLFGTNKPVKARFWPWLEPFFRQRPNKLQVVLFSLDSGWMKPVLNSRTTTSQQCEAVPRRARI